MPGLVGFVTPRGGTEEVRTVVSRMAQALEADRRFQTDLHHETGVGIGRVGLARPQPHSTLVWNSDRSVCLVMEGELYDQAALVPDLPDDGAGSRPVTDAELILRLYERFGVDVAARLNGAFVVAIWDGRARTLAVFNDRFGLFPLYYARVSGELVFASGVRALLAHPDLDRTVDLVGMNQFLVYDHMLDDRTLLESVRLLPQASSLTFRDGQLAIRPYWTLQYPEFYEPRSESVLVEQLMHYVRQAVTRQRPDDRPTGVLASGGLDSRMLLAFLCDDERRNAFRTFTFGIPGCDDARYAKEVANELRVPHHFFELRPDWLLGLADEAVRLTDGQANIVNLHALATLEEESKLAEVVYKGFMGDALLGFALKRQMWGDYHPDARFALHLGVHTEHGVIKYDAGQQRQLFTNSFQAEVGDAVYQTYRDGMTRSGASQLANQRLYFDLTQRVPRMTINGVEVVRSRMTTRLPFCDRDLVDFVLTVPPGFLFERHLVKEAFRRFYPKLTQIPVAGPNRPLSPCARDLFIQLQQLMSWHLRRAGLARVAGTERRPYKNYDGWFRTTLRSWVEDLLLSRKTLERGYFQPDQVRTLVAEHMAGARHGGRLGALVTLELWHRRFLD